MKKRALSFLLAAMMVISLLPTVAFATDLPTGANGWIVDEGDNHVWYKLEESNTKLTIGGNGEMPDYTGADDGNRPWYDYKATITDVVIQDGVTSIGGGSFNKCSSLRSINISNSVTKIGEMAFAQSALKNIDIPSSVAAIGNQAFNNCASLTSIQVNDANTTFASENDVLFSKDKSTLICYPPAKTGKEYTIPNTVTSISDRAFQYCSKLTKVEIPSAVTSIGSYAFVYCENLTSVEIPENVSKINSNTFYKCTSLAAVKIPSSVTEILNSAFKECSNLGSVTVCSTTPPRLRVDVFTNCAPELKIYVPQESVEAYKEASGWSTYVDKVVGDHIVDDVIFEPWTSTDSLPTTAGNYYLTTDVAISSTWNVPKGATPTNLDLNGHVIKAKTSASSFSAITINSGATLNLYDCVGEGCITGGDTEYGGGVFVNGGGTFNMYGGNITGNNATIGGGVCLSETNATLIMNGGNITGNNATIGGGIYYDVPACLAAGTPITLANGETELIENLQKGTKVEVFDHETGTTSSAVLFDLWKYPEKKNGALTLHFSNGIDVTVVGGHCFYEKDAKKYIPVTKYNANEYIGHKFYNMDLGRWETLDSVTYLKESVDTYVIVSEKNLNCAANGMLSAEDGIYDLLINVFDFDDEMKIDEEQKAAAIQQYGIWTIEDRSGCSETAFNALNLQYMPIVFAKGGISPKQYEDLVAYSLSIDPELYGPSAQSGPTLLQAQRPLMLLGDTPAVEALAFGGTAKVYGNNNGNVFIADGNKITVGPSVNVDAPKEEMAVWVTMESGIGQFTSSGSSIDVSKFYADNASYQVQYNNSDYCLELAVKPAPVYDVPDPTVSIPANHGDDSVKLKATVSGSNATLKEITDKDLEKLLDGENSDTVVLNFSGLSKNVKSVTIPKKSLEKIEAEMQKEDGKVEGLTINTPNGTILLPSDTVTELLKQAEGNTIKFAIESIKESKLTKDQKEAIKKFDKAALFDIYIESNGKRICTTDLGGFGGEVALMLLPYEMQKGQNKHNCKVFYIAEDGSLENIPALYNEDGQDFILELEHLSVYAVLYSENAPETCAKDSNCPLHEFSDTNINAWYHDGVHYCVANGIMKGVGNDLFKPTATISRAEIVTMLWRLAGEPYVDYYMQFKDVKEGEWYSEAVRFAAAEKIVEGYEDGSFMPNKVMTREEVATVLCRFAKYIGQDIDKATEDVNTLSYNDIFDVSEWAKEGIHYCLAVDVIEGYEDECIKPQNSLTRAEAATMIYRFCEKVLNK